MPINVGTLSFVNDEEYSTDWENYDENIFRSIVDIFFIISSFRISKDFTFTFIELTVLSNTVTFVGCEDSNRIQKWKYYIETVLVIIRL